MRAILVSVLATVLFATSASASYEDGVRQNYLAWDLAHQESLKDRVQQLRDQGYTEPGEAKVIYLQTIGCTPACTYTFMVAQSYHGAGELRPASKSVVAIYRLMVTAGQAREYYYTLTKVLSEAELAESLALVQ